MCFFAGPILIQGIAPELVKRHKVLRLIFSNLAASFGVRSRSFIA